METVAYISFYINLYIYLFINVCVCVKVCSDSKQLSTDSIHAGKMLESLQKTGKATGWGYVAIGAQKAWTCMLVGVRSPTWPAREYCGRLWPVCICFHRLCVMCISAHCRDAASPRAGASGCKEDNNLQARMTGCRRSERKSRLSQIWSQLHRPNYFVYRCRWFFLFSFIDLGCSSVVVMHVIP